MFFPPYPRTVIPTELHSGKENEFEGLAVTLILPKHHSPRQDTERETQSKSTIYLQTENINLKSSLDFAWCHLTPTFLFLFPPFPLVIFMGLLPAILDSHYWAIVWVPLFCHPRFRYSEQSTGFLFTEPSTREPLHQHRQTVESQRREQI